MSVPISAMMARALRSLMPGIVVSMRDGGAKGLDVGVDLRIDLGDRRVERVDLLEMQAQQEAMVLGHPAAQCLAQGLAATP